MTVRKLPLKQYIPDGPNGPKFQVVTFKKGNNYWHIRIRDAIIGDEPEFTLDIPKASKKAPVTAQQVANAGAGQLNEATGLVFLTKYTDGIPTYTGIFASTPHLVRPLLEIPCQPPSCT